MSLTEDSLSRFLARAETLLSELRHGKRKRSDERSRQVAAGTIGLLSLLGIAALLRKRPEDRVDPAPEPKPEPVDPNAQTMLAPPSMLPNPSAPAADIEEPKLDVNADADLDETKKLGTANEPAKE